jgi:hypothetical protein
MEDHMGRKILFGAMLVAGAAGYAILAQPLTPQQFGAEATPVTPTSYATVLGLVAGYVITLAGACSASLLRELQALRDRGTQTVDMPSFLRSTGSSVDLWLGLCASPIAYAAIWRTLDTSNYATLATIAFQNGLCCTAIASGFLKRTPAVDVNAGR